MARQVVDKGKRRFDRWIRDRKKDASHVIVVGIIKPRTYSTGAQLLEIAKAHEFGTQMIPERSFLRAWADEAAQEIRQRFESIEKADTNAYERIGAWAAGQVQARISRGILPANHPKTIAKKGSSTPLIDTGLLRSSITWKVQ